MTLSFRRKPESRDFCTDRETMVPTHFIPVSTFLLKKERGFAKVFPRERGQSAPNERTV